MSTTGEHCEQSMRTFGEEYGPFHELIDCYAGIKGRDSDGEFNYVDDITGARKYRHIEKLHNTWFIRIIREMYGDGPADALEQHVKQDFRNHEIFRNQVPEKGDMRIFWRSLINYAPVRY